MKDENIPLNNLNIPPSDSTSSFKFDWFYFLHLITPIAVGYVYYKGKQEKTELQEKLDLEIASREEIELNLKEQGIPVFKKELFQKEIAAIIKEEEDRAKGTLKKLFKVENCIKHILDIKCSPIKPKVDRERAERYLLDLSHSERFDFLDMRGGLKQIFYYDDKHCGGGYDNNGQIYRVWMKWWREKVELDKKARIEARKINLLTKMKEPNYFKLTEC